MWPRFSAHPTLFFLLERWGITWTLNALSIAAAVHSTWSCSTAVPPQTCVSNREISPCLPSLFASPFLSREHKMFLRFHFSSRSFHGCHYKPCFLLEQGYWKKSSTTSICGLLSNLFDVRLHSSFPLVPLHPVLLPFTLPSSDTDAFLRLLYCRFCIL